MFKNTNSQIWRPLFITCLSVILVLQFGEL
jgi:hypothetical protein